MRGYAKRKGSRSTLRYLATGTRVQKRNIVYLHLIGSKNERHTEEEEKEENKMRRQKLNDSLFCFSGMFAVTRKYADIQNTRLVNLFRR